MPKPHQWVNFGLGYEVCHTCGIVRRRDDKNKPCKGPTKMRTPERAKVASDA